MLGKNRRRSNRKPKRSLRPETLENRQLMTADCIDFEDLALNAQYNHSDSFVADNTGFQADITLEDFTWSGGGTTSGGFAEVQNGGLAGGAGQELQVNNTLLRFDFAEPATNLSFKYGEYGGNLNLEINGDFLNFEDFTDIGVGSGGVSNLGGVDIVVTPTGAQGQVRLVGDVAQLKIGGQELWVDEFCLEEQEQEDRFDFGDAPNSYGTTRSNFGAAHLVNPEIHLGRRVDPEPDGQPSPNANRDDLTGGIDDEDGVQFTSPIVAGSMADVEVTASTDGWLNAWVDFDGDGTWSPSEKIFDAIPVSGGVNALNFAVPGSSVTGETTHSRWRFSTNAKSLPPVTSKLTLSLPNGEVEDHTLAIRDGQPEFRLDFGDAPDSYRTTIASTGPSHRIVEGVYLGQGVDAEKDGQPTANAMGDDNATWDDEDGVRLLSPIVAGGVVEVEVIASTDGWLNAWVDFDGNGTWTAPEKVFNAEPLVAGANVLNFNVPANSLTNELTHSRWRFTNEATALPYHGETASVIPVNGEVEDYGLRIQDPDPEYRLDFGDAPETYRTTIAATGPSHRIVEGVYLGQGVDAENDGQPTANAMGDDNATWDDEDGVRFLSPVVAGGVAEVEVIASTDGWLNAWVDFDGNGTWTATEKVFNAEPLAAGSNILNFNVPANSVTNEITHSRWRFTNEAKILPYHGDSDSVVPVNGEVEDHALRIQDRIPDPQRLDFGDAPRSFGTRLSEDGPRHEINPDVFLGRSVDAEPDGQPSPNAVSDDVLVSDDEDGVRFLSPMIPGHDAKVEVIASTDGWLNAWIDFNRDGVFNPVSEAIATAQFIPAGATVLNFTVPEIDDVDPHSLTHARFRFSDDTKALKPTSVRVDGTTPNGEVEDYAYMNGDLNGDFERNVKDVDTLAAAIKDGTNTPATDLNGDGVTDQDDMDMLIEEIFGTYKGDTDLDGDVDFADFIQLSANFGQTGKGWGDGDFDGDCEVGLADFLLLSENFGKVASAAAIDAAFA